MPDRSRRRLLALSGLILLILPALASYLFNGGLPPGFGVFPPQQSSNVPGFNLFAFLIAALIGGLITAILLAPRWFGFKPVEHPAPRIYRINDGKFPFWFWPGVALCLAFWAVTWGQWAWLGSLVHYAFVPLWWGFILALDGLVYRRTGGHSLIARRPLLMLVMALSSCVGWYFFEYLDYFVLSNWYYPYNQIFSRTGYILWYGLAYTTVIPSIFEWYNLLNTFDGLRNRWANGPKLRVSRRGWWIVFGGGVLSIITIVIWPFYTFMMLWVAPLLLLVAALMLGNWWSPFIPATRGDWSMVILVGLASFFNYFIGEMWNYWSPPNNPNFWKYDVPYVNVLHIFEMPLLGYFGYLPFGMVCWVWWLSNAYLLGFSPDVDVITAEDDGDVPPPEPATLSGLSVEP